jgi:hypothetical protein
MKQNEEWGDMEAPDTTRAIQFLEQLQHVTIAVIDGEGKPWAVPVGVQKYEQSAIEWFSKSNTVHSQAIAASEEVMLTAFTSKDSQFGEFGFYARARAKKILTLPGIGRYRAEIYEAWYTDDKHKKLEINIKDL